MNYKTMEAHFNGTYGKAEEGSIVFFNEANPGAVWNDNDKKCSGISCHGTLEWYGTGGASCLTCHASGTAYDPLAISGSGSSGKHKKHVTDMGFSCDKCHYNYGSSGSHKNGILDTGNSSVPVTAFDGTNPSGQWINDTGPGTGGCSSLACHGGAPFDWYGPDNTWSLTACSSCHGVSFNGKRQVTGAAGDFGLNAGKKSHHIKGSSDPSSLQCMVCHEMSGHMKGTVLLKNGDSGNQIAFTPSDLSTLEPFCLSCHDSDGAVSSFALGGSALDPFAENSGSPVLGIAPYPYSKRVAGSWAKKYGHGSSNSNPLDFVNVNVRMRNGSTRLTCLGTGNAGSGCHGSGGMANAHGSSNEVIGAKQFDYSAVSGIYNEAGFSLCFDCHSNYDGIKKEDTLGVKMNGRMDRRYGYMISRPGDPPATKYNPPYYTSGVTTHFSDHNAGSIGLSGAPQGLLAANGYIWAGLPNDGKILKIDMNTGQTMATIATGSTTGTVNGMAYDGVNIWTINQSSNYVSRINTSDNSVTNVSIGQTGQYGIVYASGRIWVTINGGKLIEIDPVAATMLNSYDIKYDGNSLNLYGITFDGTNLWVGVYSFSLPPPVCRIIRVDPTDGSVASNYTGVVNYPQCVKYYAGSIWVPNPGYNFISKINPADYTRQDLPFTGYSGLNVIDVTYDGTDLWLSIGLNGILNMTTSGIINNKVSLNGTSMGVAYDGSGYVWAAEYDNNGLIKINVSTSVVAGNENGINDVPLHPSGNKRNMNLHWYHMRLYTNFRGGGLPAPGSGQYYNRGQLCDNCHRIFAFGKNVSCVNCHDVHGSNNAYGALYDETGYTNVSGAWGVYGKIQDAMPNLDIYPTYCAYNCHNAGPALHQNFMDLRPPNKAWFDPVSE